MKRMLVTTLTVLLVFGIAKGQAHLGHTESAIKAMYPQKEWTAGYASKTGNRYIFTEMSYGTFTYYFDKDTKLSHYCLQFPSSLTAMNGQIEVYNKKYVITSDTSWTAYLEEGGIMYIELLYDKENKISYFSYSDTK